MKILVCLHDYLPLHKGGSEIHAHQSARELARRGHEVSALFTERDLSAPELAVREGRLDGVRTLEVVHQREYADVRESYRQERFVELFRRLIRELAPDVVHFHHFALWGSGVLPAARQAGARVVITLHDYFALCDASTLLRTDGALCMVEDCIDCLQRHPVLGERWPAEQGTLERHAALRLAARERREQHRSDLASADVVISPSRFAADLLAREGFVIPERCQVLKAGYPGPLAPPRERAAGSAATGPLRVGYVGGIYPAKGLHVLVHAFEHLPRGSCELDVHGHLDWFPEYAAELQRAARGYPIRFHGPFEPAAIDRVLAGLDVLVVPSIWYENMPITIQEAYRNGLPVVATDLGGMREAVRHEESGLTFPRGDERALAAALERLASESGLYDRLAAGRPGVPGLEEVVDRLEEMYRA